MPTLADGRYWLTTLLTLTLVATTSSLPLGTAVGPLEVRGTTHATASGGEPLEIPVPIETRPGDLLVAVVAVNGPAASSPGQDWELIRSDSRGGELTQALWTRRATKSEPDAHKWGGGNRRTSQSGAIITVGGDQVDELRVADAGAAAHRLDPIVIPELHAERDGALLLGAFSLNGSGDLTISGGMSETQTSTSGPITLTTAYESLLAGTTEERVITRDTSGGAIGQLVLVERIAVSGGNDEEAQPEEPIAEGDHSEHDDTSNDTDDQSDTGESDDGGESGESNESDGTQDHSADEDDVEESNHEHETSDEETPDDAVASTRQWNDPSTWPDRRVPSATDDVTVSGHVVIDGDAQARTITVEADSLLEYHPDTSATVTVSGNVIVEGSLRLRPSAPEIEHVLKFVGIDESQMVGGHTHHPLDTDVGLWVIENGVLHAEGTDKTGWNRTGQDPSWRPGDDIRVAPMDKGDTTTFAPFTPGSPVPYVVADNGDVHRAEVFNLTRNVRIEGGGDNRPVVLEDNGRPHVQFLHCTRPQTIRNVELAYVGPRGPHDRDGSTGLDGRYGLHFHMCHDGSEGSLVESVVIRDAGNSAFVPHTSHGITFRDTISFSTYESAYWWDLGHETNDVLYDRAAAFRIMAYPDSRGYSLDGFTLGSGKNMTIRDSVVVGSRGHRANAGGFHWPSSSNSGDNVWIFERNVAHNNRGAGLSSWQNTPGHHVVADFVSFRNGQGVAHGAYRNSYVYRDGHVFDNSVDIVSKALSRSEREQIWERMTVQGDLHITNHVRPSEIPVVFRDLDLGGSIVVQEGSREQESHYVFLSSAPRFDLSKDRFKIVELRSTITVKNSDGSSYAFKPM